jgi:hypothetical protein
VFPGQDSTVFIMDVNSNVNGLHSEPGFHPEARYEFKIHFDGAGPGSRFTPAWSAGNNPAWRRPCPGPPRRAG